MDFLVRMLENLKREISDLRKEKALYVERENAAALEVQTVCDSKLIYDVKLMALEETYRQHAARQTKLDDTIRMLEDELDVTRRQLHTREVSLHNAIAQGQHAQLVAMDLRDQLDQAKSLEGYEQSKNDNEVLTVRKQYDELIKYSSTVEVELRTLLENAAKNENLLREQLNAIQAQRDEAEAKNSKQMEEAKSHYEELYSTEMKQMQQDLSVIRQALQKSELLLQQSHTKIRELEEANRNQQVIINSQKNRESEENSTLRSLNSQLEQDTLYLRNESALKETELHDLKCQLETVQLESEYLSLKLAAAMKQNVIDIQQLNDHAEHSNANQVQSLEALRMDLDDKIQQLNSQKKENDALTRQLEAANSSAHTVKAEMEEELQRLHLQWEKSRQSEEDLMQRLHIAQQDALQQGEALAKQIASADERLRIKTDLLDDLKGQLQAVRGEASLGHKRTEDLEQQVESYQQLLQVEELKHAAEKKKLARQLDEALGAIRQQQQAIREAQAREAEHLQRRRDEEASHRQQEALIQQLTVALKQAQAVSLSQQQEMEALHRHVTAVLLDHPSPTHLPAKAARTGAAKKLFDDSFISDDSSLPDGSVSRLHWRWLDRLIHLSLQLQEALAMAQKGQKWTTDLTERHLLLHEAIISAPWCSKHEPPPPTSMRQIAFSDGEPESATIGRQQLSSAARMFEDGDSVRISQDGPSLPVESLFSHREQLEQSFESALSEVWNLSTDSERLNLSGVELQFGGGGCADDALDSSFLSTHDLF